MTLGRVIAAYAGSALIEWAAWVAVLVYAFQHGGPSVAGFTSIALLVPALLLAPWAGSAADGARPGRALLLVYLTQTTAFATTAVLALVEAPVWYVVATTVVAISSVTFVRPCFAVLVPSVVVRPDQLVRANLLTGNADSFSVLLGPLVASALISVEGPALAFAGCAAMAGVGVALTAPFDRASRGQPSRAGPRVGGPIRSAVREMRGKPGALTLLLVLGGQYALIGSLDLLYVNYAFDVVDLGPAGAGLLSAAFGVGAVLGGLACTRLVLGHRLAPLLIGSLVGISLCLLLLGAWTELVVTLVALPLAGLNRSLLDVTGRMLLQRVAPQDGLASVFAALEVLTGLGLLTGALLVQVVVALAGAPAAAMAVGMLMAVITVLCAPGLRYADQHADVPVVAIRLLRAVPFLAPLPPPEVEALARAAQTVELPGATTVLAEGEVGENYLVLAHGSVTVSIGGTPVRRLGRGDGFGEIALLAAIPRTATVVTDGPVVLLSIDRPAFLTAVLGYDASADLAWSVARTWYPAVADGPG